MRPAGGLPMLVAGACAMGAGVLVASAHHAPATVGPPPTTTQVGPAPAAARPAPRPATPRRLIIPAIRVDRPLMRLGRTPSGALATPPLSRAQTPGWYRYSPTPGDRGPAVITGHVDSDRGPAVFWNLSTLEPGESVEVVRSDHRVAVFRITRVQAFAKSAFPTHQVYGRIRTAGLRLITCSGPFVSSEGGYQDNTVVFATLVRLRRLSAAARGR